MAKTILTLSMLEATIPLSSRNFDEVAFATGLDRSAPKTPILHGENVMPTPWGFSGVGTEPYLDFVQDGDNFLDEWYQGTNLFLVFSESGSVGYFLANRNYLYVYDPATEEWTLLHYMSTGDVPVSVFYLKGASYYFHPNIGLYRFTSFAEPTFVELNGLQDFNPGINGNVTSMTSCMSYLIGITEDAVYWSDPIDETEFDPEASEASLAGSTQILSVAGKMNFVLSTSDAFIIYTENNAVLGSFTNNTENPFIFREISNSAGVYSPEQTTYQANIPAHFAMTGSGLMQLSASGAQPIFPEVTDFLLSDNRHYWDEESQSIVDENGITLWFKMQYINSRILCISYGIESEKMDTILVLDLVLQKWGVVKIDHYAVVQVLPPPVQGAETYKQAEAGGETFGEAEAAQKRYIDYLGTYSAENYGGGSFVVMGIDKNLVRVDWTDESVDKDGLLIIGKLNMSRRRMMDIIEVSPEGRRENEDLTVETKSELNGNFTGAWRPYIWESMRQSYLGRNVGMNQQIKITGKLNIETLVLSVNSVGFN